MSKTRLARSPIRSVARAVARANPRVHASFGMSHLFPASRAGARFRAYNPNTILRRRNLLNFSEELSRPAWGRTNLAGAPVLSADGYGYTVIEGGGAAVEHYLQQATTSVYRVGTFIGSVEVAQDARRYVEVRLQSNNGAIRERIDLQTGQAAAIPARVVFGSVWTFGGARIEPSESKAGYWKVTLWGRCTDTAGSSLSLILMTLDAAGTATNYAGDGVSGFRATKGHLERSTATSTDYQKVTNWTTEFLAAGGDRITLFQDSACTVPVTEVEQPVGGWIGVERGTERGPELRATFTNGDAGAVVADDGDAVTVTNGDATAAYTAPNQTVTVGRYYELKYTLVTKPASSGGRVLFGGVDLHGSSLVEGTYRRVVRAGDVSGLQLTNGTSATLNEFSVWSGISVRELPATAILAQPTAGARPKLDARVNKLIATEDLSNSAWLKAANTGGTSSVTGTNQINLPATGDYVAQTANVAVAAGQVWKGRMLLSGTPGTTTRLRIRRGGTGTYEESTSPQITLTATPTEYTLTHTFANAHTGVNFDVYRGASDTATSVTATEADLRTADDAALDIPAYQRVGTATDYETEGFPHVVRGNGTSATMSCPLDMSSTDKVTVWLAGNLKANDTAAQMLLEFTDNSTLNAGSFGVVTPLSAGGSEVNFRSGGLIPGNGKNITGRPAPLSAVYMGEADIAGDYVNASINGSTEVHNSADQGTGNYANSTLHLFSRAGGSMFSTAGLAEVVISGARFTAHQRRQTNLTLARSAKVPASAIA